MAQNSSSASSSNSRNNAVKRGDTATTPRDFIAVARGADLVVIRVVGRGNMLNAPALFDFAEQQRKAGFTRFVFDLERCLGLDSTFMGVMVGIHNTTDSTRIKLAPAPVPPPVPVQIDETATVELSPEEAARELHALLAQPPQPPRTERPISGSVLTSVTAVNVSSDVRQLMAMLGVDAFVKIRGTADLTQLETTILPEKPLSPDERRRLILKAHETLVDVDRRNEAQFGSFLRTLSLELSGEK
jgi:hypothetical protein